MPMTCHDRTSTALVFEIILSVAIEPDSRARRVGAATPFLLFVLVLFLSQIGNYLRGHFRSLSITSRVMVRASDGVSSGGFFFPCE